MQARRALGLLLSINRCSMEEGRRRDMGLGSVELFTLAVARERATAARRLVARRRLDRASRHHHRSRTCDLVGQDGTAFPRARSHRKRSRLRQDPRRTTRREPGLLEEGTLPWRLLIEEGSEVTNLQRGSFPVGAEHSLEIAGILSGTNGTAGTGGNGGTPTPAFPCLGDGQPSGAGAIGSSGGTGSGGVASGGAGGKAIVGIANVDLSELTGSIIGTTS